jgi:DNA recombination protein RmuC
MITFLIVTGTIVGVLIGWHLALSRSKTTESRLEFELRKQIATRDVEINTVRTREAQLISEKSAANTALQLAEQKISEYRQNAEKYTLQIEDQSLKLSSESSALSKAKADLEAARNLLSDRQNLYEKQLKETKEAHEKAIADLREAFKALSADALKQSAPEFLRLAQETFGKLQESAKGDLQKRQEAIVGLLKPLEEQLKTYQQRLQQSENTQSQTLGEVKKQLETLGQQSQSLANETERFRMVLKSNQARGRWGEETLRRVVEAAGMSEIGRAHV